MAAPFFFGVTKMIELFPSRSRAIGVALLCVAASVAQLFPLTYVVGAAWRFKNAELALLAVFSTFGGIYLIALFGSTAFILLRTLLKGSPLLAISASGIEDRTALGAGIIGWHEIKNVKLRRVWARTSIELILHDPAALMNRLPWWKRMLRRGAVGSSSSYVLIGCELLQIRIDELLNLLEESKPGRP